MKTSEYCIRRATPNMKPHEQGELVAKFTDYESASIECDKLRKSGDKVTVCHYESPVVNQGANLHPYQICM